MKLRKGWGSETMALGGMRNAGPSTAVAAATFAQDDSLNSNQKENITWPKMRRAAEPVEKMPPARVVDRSK
jgi:hypothetical protein